MLLIEVYYSLQGCVALRSIPGIESHQGLQFDALLLLRVKVLKDNILFSFSTLGCVMYMYNQVTCVWCTCVWVCSKGDLRLTPVSSLLAPPVFIGAGSLVELRFIDSG